MKFKEYLNESRSRYCSIYKTKDGSWYMDLADKEYAGKEDATTYGPFDSYDKVEEYLSDFSNPGSVQLDKTGKLPVPKKSPNGHIIINPRTNK